MLNRYYGWYVDTGDLQVAEVAWEKELEGWASEGKPIIITEYGADTYPGLHSLVAASPWTEEYQEEYLDMARQPRPRGESILTKPMMITCGLCGLYVALANLLLIFIGKNYFGSIQIGQSIGLVAFSLMLVVAAYESRQEKQSILNPETFNSPRMNKTALIEIALAYLITQADFLNKLLGTVSLTFPQWALALLAAVILLFLWELGKLIARRR